MGEEGEGEKGEEGGKWRHGEHERVGLLFLLDHVWKNWMHDIREIAPSVATMRQGLYTPSNCRPLQQSCFKADTSSQLDP